MKNLDKASAYLRQTESSNIDPGTPSLSLMKKLSFGGDLAFDAVSEVSGTNKTTRHASYKAQIADLITDTSECLLKVFYESKYMDPELFIAALETIQEFLNLSEGKQFVV